MVKRVLSLLIVVIMIFSLAACKKDEGEFVLTSEISEERRAEAEAVLDEFMKCFESEDAAGAHALISKDFGATEEDISAFIKELRSLRENPFVKYDSYYLNGLKIRDMAIKVKNEKEDVNYVEIAPAAEEMYLALFASEGEKVSYMLAVLLAYTGEKFEIVWLNPGDFKYRGLDAYAIYEKTKELDGDRKTVAAYIYSCMLGNLVRPAGFLRYPADMEMEDLCYKMYSDISEAVPLPLELEGTSNSAIYQIQIVNDKKHGVIPLILYKTDVSISDDAAIRAEGEKVIAALDNFSPGIRDAFDYIRMNATNDTLDDNTATVNTNSLVFELK